MKFLARLSLLIAALLVFLAPASAQVPANLGWYQVPNTSLDRVQQTAWPGAGDPANVVAAWSGAAYDSKRNRLVVFGGGHGDYSGNEVYELDLNTLTPVRLNNPNIYTQDGTCHQLSPGSANISSRHTYGGLEYLPTQDKLAVLGGAAADSGCFQSDVWQFDEAALGWSEKIASSGFNANVAACSYYAPNDTVLCFDNGFGSAFVYSPAANTFTEQSPETGGFPSLDLSAVADPNGKRFYVIGGAYMGYFDVSGAAPYLARVDLAVPPSCAAFASGHYPGLAYDPVQKLIVEWHGGNTVNTYNPAMNTCNAVTYASGPGAPQNTGTHGRFRYVSALNLFILVNDWHQNAFSLRLTNADTDFAARCAAPGVLNCQGFESAGTFSTVVSESARTDGFPTSHPNLTQDTAIFLSGAASAKFHIPAGAGANDTGNYWGFFGQGAQNHTFGPGSVFYVQYAFRPDATWTGTDWTQFGPAGDNTAPKLSIFHNVIAGSCAVEEITVHDHDAWNVPTGYTNCGSPGLSTDLGGINFSNGGTLLLEQGFTAPEGGYGCEDTGSGFLGVSGLGCFHFIPNTWHAIGFKVAIGTWGNPDSTVEAWISIYGQPMKKWLNVHNFTFNTDTLCNADGSGQGTLPCPGYNVLELTQFMTAKIAGTGPAADVWYDELVISSSPIAWPLTSAPPPDTTPPTAPTNLAASAVSGSQINLTWAASTDNVGVTGYRVERCSGASCSNFTQVATPVSNSFNDTGLTASTSYSYRVRAGDAAGNLSAYSGTVTASTQAGGGSSVIATDNFNRANGDPGANWTAIPAIGLSSGFKGVISSNQVTGTVAQQSFMYWSANTFPNDQYSQIVLSTVGGNGFNIGVLVRGGVGGSCYFAFTDAAGHVYSLAKLVGGAYSPLGSSTVTAALNDIIRLQASGATITLFINGVSALSVTDTSVAAGSAGAYFNSSSPSLLADNWEGGLVGAADTTPPTVSITAPAGGANVSCTVTVSANASDNVGVAGVQFKLDGANLGSEVLTSPYSISWSTLSSPNGSHSLTAVARDAAGNSTTSAAVSVTVNNVVAVSIAPTSASVGVNGTQQFTATVTGSLNTAVSWSATGDGAVGMTGLFTAGAVSGSATVTATAAADPTKFASAPVTVTASSAIARVNTASGTSDNSTLTVASNAYSQAAGNLIVVVVKGEGTGALSSVADTAGNTYVLLTAGTYDGADGHLRMAYVKNARASSANVVTATLSAAGPWKRIAVLQYSGADLVNPLVAEAAPKDGGSGISSVTSNALTTGQPTLVVAGVGADTGETFTAGNIFGVAGTLRFGSGGVGTDLQVADRLNVAAGTGTAALAWNNATKAAIVVAAFH